ncbi:MAG: GntR family transcriptional regulator [Gammaproteobacteria bacterium]|nr:GntR family transcriptional regulator [Gammaproteobacteria bacterium]MCY4282716.1 GntR family transcriptional regulator [Gammaproteobacteria bacterium]MCY4337346.1 GntR family transcriptional regulator [Gammaproteobacteria bacterium]
MVTAKEQAYTRIRNTILSGSFPPGFQLKEEELSELCGVSRTPVRQAIQRLSAEGLITIRENRRSYVTDLSEEEFEQAFDVASMLESYSAGLAAARLSKNDLQQLRKLEECMETLAEDDVKDYRRFLELNMEFHNLIHEASGNRNLFEMIQRVPDIANTILLKSGDMHSMKDAQSEHRSIIAALELRDAKLAELRMKVHIESIRRSMRRLVFGKGVRSDNSDGKSRKSG